MKKIFLIMLMSIFFSFVFFSGFTLSAVKDTSSPKIKYSDPENNASNVTINKSIKIFFNEKIKKGTNFEKIVLTDKWGNSFPIRLFVTSDCLAVVPSGNLENNTAYVLKIAKGAVKDLSDNMLITPFNLSFRTGIKAEETPVKAPVKTPQTTPPAVTAPVITSPAPYAMLITSSSAISLSNKVTSSDGLNVYIYFGKNYVEANEIQAKYSPNCLFDFQPAEYIVTIYGTSHVILSGDNRTKPLLTNPLYVGDLNFREHLYSLFELDYYESAIRPLIEGMGK
ncbi:hypothetical protein CLHUN_12850 [Ruminiclostridium hungatei]|uniref:SbsA Ig-like domain-containing protein n=1 Tax=Ruminiclostridium hungatei TaxID=48256 RepID=A0A1V4SMM3_RUMHU|nr:Ig-like domain-containing protein [Ruminiclostridium hungatei]OPX45053.1 hypothetical protein CLHUN_12850 [Ruminiclostridium hungatei]